MHKAVAKDLAGVGHDHKGMRIILSQVAAQEHSLMAGENGENDLIFVVSVSALSIPEGGTPVHIIRNNPTGDVGGVGNHEKGFAAVEGLNNRVYQHGLEQQT